MKSRQLPEFWYALFTGACDCLVAIPVGFYSHTAFTAGGHNAALGWIFALVSILLWGWAFCCCGWEILLLHMRRANPTASVTVTMIVFCSGITALILALGITL
jgi:hypothetical protein